MNEKYFNDIEVFEVTSKASAAIIPENNVFREDVKDTPVKIDNGYEYMRWGAQNDMPYKVIDVIEGDETIATCMQFNAEICYGGGFEFDTSECSQETTDEIDSFRRRNSMESYFLGICQDLKYFAFAITVIYLNDNGKVAKIMRKNAAYCRFAPADKNGKIPYVLYANWRKNVKKEDCEKIELLDINFPLEDLLEKTGRELNKRLEKVHVKTKTFAIATMIPTADSMYYPIPPYAPLFKGKWYRIKQLIGIAKEASLSNSAPIKYIVEISSKYWERLFKEKGITAPEAKKKEAKAQKAKIIDYLTGVENTNKAIFADYYVSPDGKEQHEIKITPIEAGKAQGGDWSADMIEAINMICFAMRVHSNLVGSVPGKAQTNNSGSDKRELYTIAQALQKPYHDLFFQVPYIIIEMNGWKGAKPNCPFIQLTTLDENKDVKEVSLEKSANNGNK